MGAFARHADEVGLRVAARPWSTSPCPSGYESRYPYNDTGRMPLPEDCDIPDPLELLAWIAARTTRLRLGTGILVLPEHHPLQLAKRVATIDRLSAGSGLPRCRRRVDARGARGAWGSTPTPADRAPMRPSTRCGRSGGTRRSPSPASTSPSPSVRSEPKPVQPLVPILVGGHSALAARRAGRRGDGFFPLGLAGELLDLRLEQMAAAAPGPRAAIRGRSRSRSVACSGRAPRQPWPRPPAGRGTRGAVHPHR